MNTLFVNRSALCTNPMFMSSPDIDYPVFDIETYTNDKNETVTEFLISSPSGQFFWVNMNDCRRANPKGNNEKQYRSQHGFKLKGHV
jgi:hypothetical protein